MPRTGADNQKSTLRWWEVLAAWWEAQQAKAAAFFTRKKLLERATAANALRKKQDWFKHGARGMAVVYALILGIKFTYALTTSGVFPMPVVYLLGALATAFNIFAFWIMVPYLVKKLFRDSLYHETIELKNEKGEKKIYRVARDGQYVTVTWRARLLIGFLAACTAFTAIGAASITLKAVIPTLQGFGMHGLAHLSQAGIVGLFAPIACIVVICYMSMALKDITELLSRANCKEIFIGNVRTALALDADERGLTSKHRRNYIIKQRVIFAITLALFALAILGTLTTATIGLEYFTHGFPTFFDVTHLSVLKFDLSPLTSTMIAMAVGGMAPFLWKTLYKLVNTFASAPTVLTDQYKKIEKEYEAKDKKPTRLQILTQAYIVPALIFVFGSVSAFCQGFIAALKYPNLPSFSPAEKALASCRVVGQALKYFGLAVKTSLEWSNPQEDPLTIDITGIATGVKAPSEAAKNAYVHNPFTHKKPVTHYYASAKTSNAFDLACAQDFALDTHAGHMVRRLGYKPEPSQL